MIPTWPIQSLRPETAGINLVERTVVGAPSLNGSSFVTAGDAGVWRFDFTGFFIYCRDPILLWRSIEGLCEGQLNPINVPLYDYERTLQIDQNLLSDLSADRKNALLSNAKIPFSNDQYFSNGAGFAYPPTKNIVASEETPLRATSITVNALYGEVEPAYDFSIEHETKGHHLYRVKSVEKTDNGYVIKFRGVLKEAVPAGTRLEFDRPVCKMRLASDQEMNIDLEGNVWSTTAVSFVEYL